MQTAKIYIDVKETSKLLCIGMLLLGAVEASANTLGDSSTAHELLDALVSSEQCPKVYSLTTLSEKQFGDKILEESVQSSQKPESVTTVTDSDLLRELSAPELVSSKRTPKSMRF